MKLLLITVLCLSITYACTSKPLKKQFTLPKGSMWVFDTLSGKYIVSSQDQKLISTWESFKQAISNSNFEKLKKLSFDSIICSNCVQTDEDPILTSGIFYKEHASRIFSNSFSAILSDDSNIRCTYDLDSSYYYAYPILSTISDIATPKLAIIFVSSPVLNSQGERNSKMLGFLECKQGYKFFGFSTMP